MGRVCPLANPAHWISVFDVRIQLVRRLSFTSPSPPRSEASAVNAKPHDELPVLGSTVGVAAAVAAAGAGAAAGGTGPCAAASSGTSVVVDSVVAGSSCAGGGGSVGGGSVGGPTRQRSRPSARSHLRSIHQTGPESARSGHGWGEPM